MTSRSLLERGLVPAEEQLANANVRPIDLVNERSRPMVRYVLKAMKSGPTEFLICCNGMYLEVTTFRYDSDVRMTYVCAPCRAVTCCTVPAPAPIT